MTAIMSLHNEAGVLDGYIERLTRDIEDTEKRIVDLRQKRDDARFRRLEALTAATFLANSGFHVDRDAAGVVTVHVDPIAGDADLHPNPTVASQAASG